MGEDINNATRDALGIHSPGKEGESTTKSHIDGMMVGFKKTGDKVVGKAKELGIDVSKMTYEGMTETLETKSSSVTTAIVDLIDILSGAPAVVDSSEGAGNAIGNNVTSAMNKALSNSKTGIGGSKNKETIKSELEKLQDVLEEKKYYGQISLDEELAAYTKIQNKYKAGSEERKKIDREVYRLTKEIYTAQTSYIDSVTQAEREAAEEREKLYSDHLKSVQAAEQEASKRLNDLRKTYDKNVADARESAREKEADREKKYQEDINKLIENAEKERQKIREDYANKQKSINEKLISDIDAQNKAYEDAVKSRADAIYGSYSLFGKVEEDPEVTGDELLQNLRDQGAALSEWKQSLEALSARGVGDALIEELQKLGPSSKAQIKALITLTDEQLEEYVGLFEGKYTFARVKAETELEGLKESTSQIIADLRAQAELDLQGLDDSFAKAMADVNAQMAVDMNNLKSIFDTDMSEIRNDLAEKLSELKTNFDTTTAEINADLAEKLSEMQTKYDESLKKINDDADKKLKDLKSSFSTTMKDVKDLTTNDMKALIEDNRIKLADMQNNTNTQLGELAKTYDKSGDTIVSNFATDMSSLNTNTSQSIKSLNRTAANGLSTMTNEFVKAGWNVARGFADGIYDGAYMASMAAQYMAQKAVDSAKTTLNQHSPSRVFHEIGEFVVRGFAEGIEDNINLTKEASVRMAQGPIAAISQALSNMDDDMTYEPVISPVLDLSRVDRRALGGLFGSSSVSVDTIRRARETVQNGTNVGESESNIVNNFNIQELVVRREDDIDKISTALYKKQQTNMRGRGLRPRLS